MTSPKLSVILAGCFLLPALLAAQTAFLSVDINAGTGTQSPTQPGFTGWGLTTGTGVGPLVTSFAGLDTTYTANGTVGLTLTFPTPNSSPGTYTSRDRTTTAADTGDFTYNALYRDLVGASSQGALIFNFTGLLANTTYELRFYAYDDSKTSSQTMTFTDWTSGSAGTGTSTGSVTFTGGYAFTGSADDNNRFSTLITATSDSSGNLVIEETAGSTYPVLFNGFQISAAAAIPEPATYAVIYGSLVLIGAVAYRRRQKNQGCSPFSR